MTTLTHVLLTLVFVLLVGVAVVRRLSPLSVAVLSVATILLILPVLVPAIQNPKFIIPYFAATGISMVLGIALFAVHVQQHA